MPRRDEFLYDPANDLEHAAAVIVWTAAIGGLAHPRTRGPAFFALSVLTSRAHGAAMRRLDSEYRHLFDERDSARREIDGLGERTAVVEARQAAQSMRSRALLSSFEALKRRVQQDAQASSHIALSCLHLSRALEDDACMIARVGSRLRKLEAAVHELQGDAETSYVPLTTDEFGRLCQRVAALEVARNAKDDHLRAHHLRLCTLESSTVGPDAEDVTT